MSTLDDFDTISARLDRIAPARVEFDRIFQGKTCSALVIDPDDLFTLTGSPLIKYIDLSQCSEGDYRLIGRALSSPQFDGMEGILFDNVDRIPDIADKESLEELVRFALKREDGFPLPCNSESDGVIDFGNLHVGARCSEIPDYLKGKSLQAIFINV